MQINGTVYKPPKWSVFLIALFGCLLLTACNRRQQPPPPPVAEVATVTIEPRQVELTTELPGRTSAYRTAEIRPQVSGIIQKRLFTEGTNIKTGEVLYLIDPAPFQAALDNASAALGRAEANLPAIRLRAKRYRELLAEKAVSQQDYDDVAAALKQTEADIRYWKATLETARINMAYTHITAPISGRIGRSNVNEGAIVMAYQPVALATIQQLDPIYVDVPQSTIELLRLKRRLEEGNLSQNGKKQNKVRIILEDATAYPMEGILQFRDVTVEPTTGSVILRVVVPNPNTVLLPGMFLRTLIKEGVSEHAILIPQQAVLRDPKGNPQVLIIDVKGRVQQRMLTIDRAIGDKWLVTSGLAKGDRVIIEGIQKVRPGAPVQVVPFEADSYKSGAKPETGHRQSRNRN
ncbi:MAG: efflux RND transporter periplasmic adaptor subunit [Thermodesulfobacteriota bacterium]